MEVPSMKRGNRHSVAMTGYSRIAATSVVGLDQGTLYPEGPESSSPGCFAPWWRRFLTDQQ
jgi:hypothetical protein